MSKIEIIVKLMVEITFYACYHIIRFWDFSLDFTERVTFFYLFVFFVNFYLNSKSIAFVVYNMKNKSVC